MILEARAVSVRRDERTVVHDVNLSLDAGTSLAVVGPNAAGKSTLVLALAGLLPPASGEIVLDGMRLDGLPREAVGRAIALVTPGDAAAGALSVRERVSLGRYPHLGPLRPFAAKDHAAVALALASTGIEHLADRRLASLSAGERQLAALARGLAQDPRVLLLDEPAAHLDIGHQLELFRVLDEVRAGGVGVLAVVHDLQRAAAWASRMLLLDRGRVVAEGDPHAVLSSAACANAFGVTVRGHAVPGSRGPLYAFERSDHGPARG